MTASALPPGWGRLIPHAEGRYGRPRNAFFGYGGHIHLRVCARIRISRVDLRCATRSASLAVPELTRSVDIQVNERVSLWRAAEILSSGSRAVLARRLRSPARPCVFRAIRGRRFARGRRPRPIAFGDAADRVRGDWICCLSPPINYPAPGLIAVLDTPLRTNVRQSIREMGSVRDAKQLTKITVYRLASNRRPNRNAV